MLKRPEWHRKLRGKGQQWQAVGDGIVPEKVLAEALSDREQHEALGGEWTVDGVTWRWNVLEECDQPGHKEKRRKQRVR
jgi:hypothetical protein